MRTIISLVLALLAGPASADPAWTWDKATPPALSPLPGCRALLANDFSAATLADTAMLSFNAGICIGVIEGLILGDLKHGICATEKDDPKAMVAFVIKYIEHRVERHPQDIQLPFSVLAHTALQEARPCKH